MPRTKQPITPLVSDMLSASQAEEPERLFGVLATTAVKESWIILLIHFHTAIFFGLILLASGYDELTSIVYLAIHLSGSLVSSLVLVYLIRQSPENLIANLRRTIIGLTAVDVVISTSWGISILLFFLSSGFDQASTLVVLLLAAGISSAALSAKLLHIMVLGRVLVFLPTIVLLIWLQPPDWILHSTSLVLSFGVSIGVGYAIHVQLLREASLVVELGATQAKIVNEAELRERFLRSITHDLRQPLASLGLHARALSRRSVPPEVQSDLSAIDACLSSANEIMRSVSQLAWVSDSLPAPQLQAVAINSVIQRIVDTSRPLANNKGLDISYVATSLKCMAEESYLERAVRNLVDNAIEHTTDGRILVGVRNRKRSKQAEIQVWDTGSGIARENQAKVFEVYKRLDTGIAHEAGHLGLGLSIVETIAEAMGGRVLLRSVLGEGSCFSLRLQAAGYNGNSSEPSIREITSVLVVEDDPDYAKYLHDAVSELGVRCLCICNKSEIDNLFVDGLPSADCYLIDYHLSPSQTGLELLKLAAPTAVKLLISNFDTPQLRLAAKNIGVDFLPKPQGEVEVRQFINQVLAK